MDRRRAAIIWGLGLTQIIGYGSLYYSFPILAPQMARDFSWSTEWVFGAFSASLLLGGLAAPSIGRWMDRYGAGQMMSLGSVIAAIALVLCAFAPERITFVAGLVAVEVASAFVLYNAAFALLVQITPQNAQRSITHLTLIAGFASTLFWPITSALLQHMSWREVYLVFAGINLLVCLPIHLWLSSIMKADRRLAAASTRANVVIGTIPAEDRPRAFLLMATGFALEGFVLSAVLIHMVPLLTTVGLGASAVLVGTVFGPSQVFSRFTNMVFGKAVSPLFLAVISASLLVAGMAVLLASAPSFIGAVAFAILFGLGAGLTSIVQGSLPLHLFGSDGYGALLGKISAARLLASAVAPFVFAFLLGQAGTWSALCAAIALAIGAGVAFAGISWRRRSLELVPGT
ncbi:MFS transporter [Mesorhizobium loti]|nr:arsenite efflux MFS transporter ArsK [Mesorhizobium loti]PLP59124.1 MFS transporter [Mesorhizobium loti]